MIQTALPKKIRITSAKLGMTVVAMFVFGYALIPLYDVLCEIAGINGKSSSLQQAAEPVDTSVDLARQIKVEFTSSTMSGLPWSFTPESDYIEVNPGSMRTIYFVAKNLSSRTLTAQAIPSIAPGTAARYFKKIECFCFNKQLLAAGEETRMGVTFNVAHDLPDKIGTITLSYAMFKVDNVNSEINNS